MKTSPTATRRRDAILHATLELFAPQSVAAMPVPVVAERAGVGTGPIYRYWSSKEELVNDLYRFCKRALTASLDIPPHVSARQTFGAWWQRLLAFAEEHPDAFEFLEAHKHQPDLDRKSLALDATLQGVAVCLIKDWQDKGAICDLELTALLTLAHGAFVGLRKAMAAGHLNLNDDLIAVAEERVMKALDIYRYATSYDKIKSQQIINGLYTGFTPWEGILDFKPSLKLPNGEVLTLQHDPAMIIGVAEFHGNDVAIIAQQTPPSPQERSAYNYGLVQADGYGLALSMMCYAEQYGLSLHTFVDTVGGDPFEDSAAKLQSWLIARCQAQMLSLKTRTISTIIGQGGSGGAIAIQLAHRRLMLALSTYAVIAPEGCAAILFRHVNDKTVAAAVDILQPTAEHMLKYGIIDAIIPEPSPEEPEYHAQTLANLDAALKQASTELADQLLEDLQYDLRDRVGQCGCVAEQKPWYQRARRLTTKLWDLARPSTTTDPYIASIRRHVFGNPDCVPQACNTVKDQDGQVVRRGCGRVFPIEEFRDNWHACPACHRPNPLDPVTYTHLLLDPESFHEIYAHLKLEHVDGWTDLYNYSSTRQKMEKQTPGKEALMIGHGTMFGDLRVALALSNFAYMGGSMGAVVGEKFRAIVQFACDHHLPLIAVSTTGGARMQEGTVALAQMAKTTAAVMMLREAGLPYVSILGHPTVGGVLASYATLGDFIIAEEKATLSFAGDRVVKLTSGGRGISPECMTSEFFAQHGGLHAVVKRQEMKPLIAGLLRMTPWYREAKLDF